jgi:hypothetical protein
MRSYCVEHKDYLAKRRPKVNCLSCWRLFFETRGTTVEAYASEIDKQDKDLSRWLRENIDEIIYAPLGFESKHDLEFITEEQAASIIKPSEVPTAETVPSKEENVPAFRGIKI